LQVVDVDDGNSAISAGDYTSIARVTDYRHGKYIGDVFRKNNGLKLSNLANYTGWLSSRDSVVFIDNHETQRGLGPSGFDGWLTSFVEFNLHKLAVAFKLAWPYGHVQLFSGYFWSRNIVDGVDQVGYSSSYSNTYGFEYYTVVH
jgi:alpha-amylase